MKCLCSQPINLFEDMSFKQLRNMSEPKRIYRAATQVRTSQLNIDAFSDSVYYYFNFKSAPSTEGRRHKGYVRFIRPRYATTNVNGKRTQKQLQDMPCIVDCDCKDYRYRWAWVNKQKRASRVGTSSLNQAFNRAPFKTNPGMRPGLCKHLLAMSSFIYGQVTSFGKDPEMDLPTRLSKLLKGARKYAISGDVANPVVVDKTPKNTSAIASKTPPPELPLPPGEKKLNIREPNPQNKNNSDITGTRESKQSRVDNGKETSMTNLKKLQEATRLVEEIEASEPIIPDHDLVNDGDSLSPEPTETQGDEALDTLKEIRDILKELVGGEEEAEDELVADEEALDDKIPVTTEIPGDGEDFQNQS